MNLTELQTELRNIENQLSRLHAEIEKMKPLTEEQRNEFFEGITKIAKEYPIKTSGIVNVPEIIKHQLINGLSYLLLTDENNIYTGLLYICRLASGAGIDYQAEEIYKAGFETEKNIERFCRELQDYRYTFLIESCIIINLLGKNVESRLSLIADIAKLMGCDKEEVGVIALAAKSRLLDDTDIMKSMSVSTKNRWGGKLKEYIPREWIISQRQECATICTEKYVKKDIGVSNFVFGSYRSPSSILDWINSFSQEESSQTTEDYKMVHPCIPAVRTHSGCNVTKGQTILDYEENGIKKSVTAPCDGIVFFIESWKRGEISKKKDKYFSVYVTSYFDDYDDFRGWYRSLK